MKTFQYTITDQLGIHARPAGQLVKIAAAYQSDIKIGHGAKTVDAKRIMGVMGLGAKRGGVVTITCEGADEAEAATSLERFFRENL